MTVKQKLAATVLSILIGGVVVGYWPDRPDHTSLDMDERLDAIRAMIPATDADDLDILSELVNDGEPRVAMAAVRAIGSAGGELNRKALEHILAENDTPSLCGAAMAALGKFDDVDYHTFADVMLDETKSPDLRAGAAKGLKRLRSSDAAGALSKALADPDANVRHAAIDALHKTTGMLFEFDPTAPPATRVKQVRSIERQLARRGMEHLHHGS